MSFSDFAFVCNCGEFSGRVMQNEMDSVFLFVFNLKT